MVRRRGWMALLLGPLALGCFEAGTDRGLYAFGESGKTTFLNGTSETVFLLGCAIPFTLEQRVDGEWETRFPLKVPVDENGEPLRLFDLVCGPAEAVEPGASMGFEFTTQHVSPLPAELRIRYAVGISCTQTLEVGDFVAYSLAPICDRIAEVATPVFLVE